jgi:serine/threonine protein kinase
MDGPIESIKIADFGFSKNFGEDKLKTSCGSPGYVAPEVFILPTSFFCLGLRLSFFLFLCASRSLY